MSERRGKVRKKMKGTVEEERLGRRGHIRNESKYKEG